MSARELITERLDLWTGAVKKKSSSGRGSSGKVELIGIKKLRELILELAVRGKLVTQDEGDEPIELLFKKIESEMRAQLKAKTIRKPKKLSDIGETEQPFPIPKSWRYCRLNELGIWGSGATPKRGNTSYYGGEIPWFKSGELYKDFIDSSEEKITDLAVQETSVRMNRPGDVLIAMYGATIGKVAILEVAGTTNQAVCACTPWLGISNRFLLLVLKAYRSRFIAMGAGGAQPNISREKIIATVIGMPPEREQHRIVQKVDELMALCDRLEQQTSDQLETHGKLVDTLLGTLTQSENATELADNWARVAAHFDTLLTSEQSIDKLKQTILQLAVMGRLVERDSGDEPAARLLKYIKAGKAFLIENKEIKKQASLKSINLNKASDQIPIPEHWVSGNIDELCHVQGGIQKQPKRSPLRNKYPYLRVADVQRGFLLDCSNLPEFELFSDEPKQYELKEGDILVVEGNGSSDEIGRCAIWDGRVPDCVYQNHLMRVRPIITETSSYLALYLNSPSGIQEMKRLAVTSSGLYNLSVGKIRGISVPLPPLPEQFRIVQKVDELIALCNKLKEHLDQARETSCQFADATLANTVYGSMNRLSVP